MQESMTVIKRQPGDRRWGLPVQFPLTDSEGVPVARERRSGGDRRKSIATLEDLLILFSELPSINPQRKQ
jgi:hypothetical protein